MFARPSPAVHPIISRRGEGQLLDYLSLSHDILRRLVELSAIASCSIRASSNSCSARA